MRNLLLGLAATLSFGSAANAATIVNGSFENGVNPGSFTTLSAGSPAINGWSVGGASIDYIGTYWNAKEGERSIDLAGLGLGNISQVIATNIGQAYNVSFWVARNPDGGITPRIGFVDVGGTPTAISFGNGLSSTSDMKWEQRNFYFTASSLSTTLRFAADPATSGSNFGMALDDITMGAVPEPSTWLMMLFGFGLIGGALRSRKKQMIFA